MSISQIERNDVIERYLRDQLTEEQRTEFEIQMLDDPELVREIQCTEILISELKGTKGQLPRTTSEHENNTNSNIGHLSFGQWIKQPISIAASIAIGFSLFIAYSVSPSLNPRSLEVEQLTIRSYQLIERMRSSNLVQALNGDFPMLLQIDASEAIGSDSVTVTIRASDNAVIFQQRNLSIDNEGWIRILLQNPIVGQKELNLSWQNTSTQLQESDPYVLSFSN